MGDEVVRLRLTGVLVGGGRPRRAPSTSVDAFAVFDPTRLYGEDDPSSWSGDFQSEPANGRHQVCSVTAEQLEDAFLRGCADPFDLATAAEQVEMHSSRGPVRQKKRTRRARDVQPPRYVDDATALYLDEIRRIRLLTPRQELRLAKKIRAGAEAQRRLAQMERPDVALGDVDVQELRADVRRGDDAEARMVVANLRLVASVARRYTDRGLPLLDLVQDGNLGLMHAVKQFDHTKGFRFSTYAVWWIRQSITRGIADKARVVRLPVHMHELVARVRRAEELAQLKADGVASVTEIAILAGTSADKVRDCQAVYEDVPSLDEYLSLQPGCEGAGEDFLWDQPSMSDTIRDEAAPDGPTEVFRSACRDQIDSVLGALTERERTIVRLRFGLADGRGRTLEEIGALFGLTRERIRQIEKRALSKLTADQNTTILRDFRS